MPEEKKLQFDPTSDAHVISRQGKKFITFVGLQAKLADQLKFIAESKTEDVLWPWDNPYHLYVCRVTIKVINAQGKEATYQATGDAGIHSAKEDKEKYEEAIDNVGGMVKPHFIRMAETRALVRALRLATRSEYTANEELD